MELFMHKVVKKKKQSKNLKAKETVATDTEKYSL